MEGGREVRGWEERRNGGNNEGREERTEERVEGGKEKDTCCKYGRY